MKKKKSLKIMKKEDMVNSPNHYAQTRIECIDAIEAMVEPYKNSVDAILSYQVLKYLWRHPFKKNPIEDLRKCEWYLKRLINHYEKGDIK